MTTLLYAHGFRSSSNSRKATQLADYLRTHRPDIDYRCPDLAFQPSRAIAQLREQALGKEANDLVVIGSSLGGFYAIVLAEELGCKAVLLNPSIRPFETLAKYLGEQTNIYTGEHFTFDSSHIAELQSLFVEKVSRPERYLLIVEMGDELLDHDKTQAYLEGAHSIVVEGGDHELMSFPRHIPALIEFIEKDMKP